jgi:hypothetical protein
LRTRLAASLLAILGLATGDAPWVTVVGDQAVVDLAGPLPRGAGHVELELFVGEVGAFQLLVDGGAPTGAVSLELPELTGVRLEAFVEHGLAITERSRGRDERESLGWSPAARPAQVPRLLPDALLPLAPVRTWSPYPLELAPGTVGALWVDVHALDPGRHETALTVRGAQGASVRVPLTIVVRPVRLPVRAVSVIADLDGPAVAERQGQSLALIEPSIWGTLVLHGVDPLPDLSTMADAERLAPALRGDWSGGLTPQAVTIGGYGKLGEPTPGRAELAMALLARVPPGIPDVFLYAVDEDCKSPRPAGWRKALGKTPRLMVGATCDAPPEGQAADLVMTTAQAWSRGKAASAARAGKRLWIYNGQLPRAPTLLLDAPPGAALAFGWIAAARPIDRWFLWATTFWNDDNRGGHGPVDPYVTAASFHNSHGDVALGDGLLVYPGRQVGRFAAHSPGVDGVLPSMRLKRLRRGLHDAGLIALAAHVDPRATAAIVAGALPRSLDQVAADEATPWDTTGERFVVARARLRALVPDGLELTTAQAQAALAALRAALPEVPEVAPPGSGRARWLLLAVFVAGGLTALGLLLVRRRLSRR